MPPVFKQSWEIRAATETSSMVNPKCWKIMSASLYLCASGQNMKWTCLLSNCKIVTFWTFLSDFWTIIMHPGLVFVSAVFVSFFLTARTTGLFLDENFFFSDNALYKLQKKIKRLPVKSQNLATRAKVGTSSVSCRSYNPGTTAFSSTAWTLPHWPCTLSCSQYLARSWAIRSTCW